MSELPKGWFEKPLGSLAEPRRGITYSAAMLEAEEGGLPYINMKSFIKGGGFNRDGTKSYAGFHTPADLVGERDLLIANTDVTAGDIVGVPALLPEHLASSSVLYSHHVTRLRLNDEVTVPFLYYLLCLPEYRAQMLRIARGTTVLMLDMQAIKRVSIRAPKLETTQTRIAEILKTVDEAMEQTEALVAKLQQMKAGLMHDLFTRGVTPDGHLRPTHQEAPHLYHETPLGWLPKEWSFGGLSDYLIGGPKNGYSPREVSEWSGLAALGLGCLTSEGFKPIQLKAVGIESLSCRDVLLEDGDLLISRSNTRDLVGLCGTYRDIGLPCIYPDLMMRIRPNSKTSSGYLESLLLSPQMRRQITGSAVGTSGSMVKINSRSVLRLQIAMPAIEEQSIILERIRCQQECLELMKSELAKLRQQKQGLMQDLLTGREPVKV